MIKINNEKRAQIWIETVIYTTIALILISVVLAFFTPKINQAREKLVIEQSIQQLQELDDKIQAVVSKGEGNRRIVQIKINTGTIFINSSNDSISIVMEGLRGLYAEPNVLIKSGSVGILVEKKQRGSSVHLSLNYPFNITYSGKDSEEPAVFTYAANAYKFSLTNNRNSGVDIEEIS